MATNTDLLQGTLDLLILKTLALGPLHGWGIAQRLHQMSEAAFTVTQGSLYPALHRLEGKGLLDATWEQSDTARRVKSYRLTAAGKRQLAAETKSWAHYAHSVRLVLEST